MRKTCKPLILGQDDGPWRGIRRWLVLAPHPDDFDSIAVTLRRLADAGCELRLEVLTGAASGVEDVFLAGWELKTRAREEEQRAGCRLFGLEETQVRFHRLAEDDGGHMIENGENEGKVRKILDRSEAGGVFLPHGNDSNADHRRTFRFFERWAREQECQVLALLIRDPKTLDLRLDLVTPFQQEDADWKASLLRCHVSQQERNLRTRGHGFDHRILEVNRAIAAEAGAAAPFAEGFEVGSYGK